MKYIIKHILHGFSWNIKFAQHLWINFDIQQKSMQKYMQYVNIKFHETSTNNCLTNNSPTIVETVHFFLPTHEVINVYNFYSRQKYSLKLK